MKTLKIPEATIIRLSVYSRFLSKLARKGIVTVSSGDIAEGVGVSSAQVRKDLAYFGEFGTRGVGYDVKDLQQQVLRILGLNKKWNVIIVGAGNLGTALSAYHGFKDRGFEIFGIFDNDANKIGRSINDIKIMSFEELPKVVKQNQVKIAILTVPAVAAQDVADYLIDNGIVSILNFAPVVLSVSSEVIVRNIDLSVSLEILTYNMTHKIGRIDI